MIDLRNIDDATIAVAGRIPGMSKGELNTLLFARGAKDIRSSANKDCIAMFSPTLEGKAAKAIALNIPVILPEQIRSAIGEPMEGYRERLVATLRAGDKDEHLNVLSVGKPLSKAMIKRIEERIGFPMPVAARKYYAQMDHLSFFWSSYQEKTFSDEPLGWSDAADMDGELWRGIVAAREKMRGLYHRMGFACIPPAKTVFFQEWNDCMFFAEEKGSIKVGKKKVKNQDFWRNLFIFDIINGYHWSALWADPKTQEFYIVLGSDYGADFTISSPVPFEFYMEHLLYHRGFSRMIAPGNPKGLTQGMRKHSDGWHQLNPYDLE